MGQDIQNIDQLIAEIKLLFNSRRNVVIVFGCFLVSVAIAWWGILPQWQNSQTNRDDLSNLENEVNTLEKKQSDLNQTLSQVTENDIGLVNNLLSSSKPFLEILYALAEARSAYPVTFSQLNFSPGEVATSSATTSRRKSATQQEYLTLNLAVSGRHETLMSFLNRIETMQPLSTITNLDLSKRDDSFSSAKLELKTYYYTQAVNPSISAAVPTISAKDKDTLKILRNYTLLDVDQLNQNRVEGGEKDNLFGYEQINITDYIGVSDGSAGASDGSNTGDNAGAETNSVPETPAETESATI